MSSWTIRGLLSQAASEQTVSNQRTMMRGSIVDDVTDEAVMQRVQSGDTQALSLLYDRYSRLVLSLGLKILRDVSEAQELVQDVFLYLFQKSHTFDSKKGALRAWLVQITYSRAFNKREYLALRRFYDYCQIDEVLDAASDFSPEQFGMISEIRGRLADAFASLSEQQRTTLELFFWEGYSLREISVQLQETLGNTRNHYYRGLEKLKQVLSVSLSESRNGTE